MRKSNRFINLQQRILDNLLLVLFLSALPVISFVAYEEFSQGVYYRVLYFYIPLLVILGLLTFLKKTFRGIRPHILIFLIVFLAITELIYWGFNSLAFYFFLSAAILASLLNKPLTGWLSFIFSLICIMTTSFLYSKRIIPITSDIQLNSLEWRNWIAPILSYIMIQVTVLIVTQTIINHLIFSIDEIERKRKQLKKEKDSLERTAYTDPVTGLSNNMRVVKDIAELMAEKDSGTYTIDQILIEISDFSSINIKYGLETGNYVLQIIAGRLQDLKGCTIYRMTGAAFLINCTKRPDLASYSPIEEIFSEPVSIDRQIIPINFNGAHIRYPDDITNPTLLLPNLMMTIYNSRTLRSNSIIPFDDIHNQKLIRTGHLRDKLANALDFDEITILIQPRLDSLSGKITGGELLMRWNNKSFGSVKPSEFIPISEKDEQIFALTHYLMEKSLLLKSYFKPELEDGERFTISVNISPHIIHSDRLSEYIDYIEDLDKSFAYEFELTEGVFLGVDDRVREELDQLHRKDISVSIDDFGTGYSNLEYLQDLNVNILKIDKKFIDGLPTSEKQMHLVKAVIQMADALELKTVAEGVEHSDQIQWLQKQGIGEIQGFILSKPIKLEELQSFYDSHDREKWRYP